MTLEDEQNCLQTLVLKCNVSACNQNLSLKSDEAWITVCGHIFCASCGIAELNNLPALCPTCSHNLTSPFDILKAELKPPSHFIKMVLMGLHPDDCMEAARNGIQFWYHQSNLQLRCLETTVQDTQLQVAEMQNHYENKISEMNREITALREECHCLKETMNKQKLPTPSNRNFPVKCNAVNQKLDEKPVEAYQSNAKVVKKQSYPPPSIPPRVQSRDVQRKSQFWDKY